MLLGAVIMAAGLTYLAANSTKDKTREMTEAPKPDLIDRLRSLCSKDNTICSYRELKSVCGEGIWISENVRLSVAKSNEHILVIAPSGERKTRSVIIPNVNTLKNCSIIVSDPCGEIAASYRGNKRVYIFNPFSDNTIGYDPLIACKSEFDIRNASRSIIMNGCKTARNGTDTDHTNWLEMSLQLFTAYMLYCYNEGKYTFDEAVSNVCTRPIITRFKGEEQSIYDEIMSSNCIGAKKQIKAISQQLKAEATIASIRSTMNSSLQIFMDDNVCKLCTREMIDFSKFRDEESILFIQVPEMYNEYFAPLTATLMGQLITTLLYNKGLQINMLLDEFTNIGAIPDMAALLSTARKHTISITASIQSINQLARTYSRDAAELQELFKTVVCTCGLRSSAEYISDLIGVRHSYNNGVESIHPLIDKDEIRRMKQGQVLIVHNNKRPVMDNMIPINYEEVM